LNQTECNRHFLPTTPPTRARIQITAQACGHALPNVCERCRRGTSLGKSPWESLSVLTCGSGKVFREDGFHLSNASSSVKPCASSSISSLDLTLLMASSPIWKPTRKCPRGTRLENELQFCKTVLILTLVFCCRSLSLSLSLPFFCSLSPFLSLSLFPFLSPSLSVRARKRRRESES
jgi:hypothetical protein